MKYVYLNQMVILIKLFIKKLIYNFTIILLHNLYKLYQNEPN